MARAYHEALSPAELELSKKRKRKEAKKARMSPSLDIPKDAKDKPKPPPIPKDARRPAESLEKKLGLELYQSDYPSHFRSEAEREKCRKNLSQKIRNKGKVTIHGVDFNVSAESLDFYTKFKVDSIPILSDQKVRQAYLLLKEAADSNKKGEVSKEQYTCLEDLINNIPKENKELIENFRWALDDNIKLEEITELKDEDLEPIEEKISPADIVEETPLVAEKLKSTPPEKLELMSEEEADYLFGKALKLAEKQGFGIIGETFGEIHEKNYKHLRDKILQDKNIKGPEKNKQLNVLLTLVDEFELSQDEDLIEEVDLQSTATEKLLDALYDEQKGEGLSKEEFARRFRTIQKLGQARDLKQSQGEEYEKSELSVTDLSYLRKKMATLDKSSQREIKLSELFEIVNITSTEILKTVDFGKIQKFEDELKRLTPSKEIGVEMRQTMDDALYLLRSTLDLRVGDPKNFKRQEISPFQFEYLKKQILDLSKDAGDEDKIHTTLYSLFKVKEEEKGKPMTPAMVAKLDKRKKDKEVVIVEDIDAEATADTVVAKKPEEPEKPKKTTLPVTEKKPDKPTPDAVVQPPSPEPSKEPQPTPLDQKPRPAENIGESLRIIGSSKKVKVDRAYRRELDRRELKRLSKIARKAKERRSTKDKETDRYEFLKQEAIKRLEAKKRKPATKPEEEKMPAEKEEPKKSWLRKLFSRGGGGGKVEEEKITPEQAPPSSKIKKPKRRGLWRRFLGLFSRRT